MQLDIANQVLLHLSLIDDIGPITIKKIIAQSGDDINSISDLYKMNVSEIMHRFELPNQQAIKISEGLADKTIFEKEYELSLRSDVQIITILDNTYPLLLKEIYAPPAVLYIKGELKNEKNRIAVVGSRKANRYGKNVINLLIGPLIENGWEIVSGGAVGIDSMAHQAALDALGSTIVVLGSGLLIPYPFCNKNLFEAVIENGGALISSFPLKFGALPGNFPARNRIISGLSRGCVVVQAAKKSGACITAFHAVEQGREVFAVPGQIDDPLSFGCHMLIGQGAKLVTSANDILQEFGQSVLEKETQFSIDDLKNSDPIERTILDRCAQQPTSINELIDLTQLSLHDLQSKLFNLQVVGKIRQTFIGLWQR